MLESFQRHDETVHALDDVDLEVAEVEFIVMVGPSGSENQTLLDVVAELESDEKAVLATISSSFSQGDVGWSCFESALFHR